MTTPDPTTPARRTYASLVEAWGFQNEGGSGRGDYSIKPMGLRSFWRFIGTGKATAKDALYEEVAP